MLIICLHELQQGEKDHSENIAQTLTKVKKEIKIG